MTISLHSLCTIDFDQSWPHLGIPSAMLQVHFLSTTIFLHHNILCITSVFVSLYCLRVIFLCLTVLFASHSSLYQSIICNILVLSNHIIHAASLLSMHFCWTSPTYQTFDDVRVLQNSRPNCKGNAPSNCFTLYRPCV